MDALRNTLREWSLTAFTEQNTGDDALAGTSSGALLDIWDASPSGDSHPDGRGDSADDDDAFLSRRAHSRSAVLDSSSRHSFASLLGGHYHLQPSAQRWAGQSQRTTRNDFSSGGGASTTAAVFAGGPRSPYRGSGVDEEGERHHLRDCLRSVMETSSHSHSTRTAAAQRHPQRQRTSDASAVRHADGGRHTPTGRRSTEHPGSPTPDGLLPGLAQSTTHDDDDEAAGQWYSPVQQQPATCRHLSGAPYRRSDGGFGTPVELTEEEDEGKSRWTPPPPPPAAPLLLSMAALQAHLAAMQRHDAQQQPSQPQLDTRAYGVSPSDYVAEHVAAILKTGGVDVAHGLVTALPSPVADQDVAAARHVSPPTTSSEPRARVPAMCARLLSTVMDAAPTSLPTPQAPLERTCSPASADVAVRQRGDVSEARDASLMHPVHITGSTDEHTSERAGGAGGGINEPCGSAAEATQAPVALHFAPGSTPQIGGVVGSAAAAAPCITSSSSPGSTPVPRAQRYSLLCPALCSADDHTAAHMLPMAQSHGGEHDAGNAVNAVAASPKTAAAAAHGPASPPSSGKSRRKPLLVPQPRLCAVDLHGNRVLLRAERHLQGENARASHVLHSMPTPHARHAAHNSLCGATRLASVPLAVALAAGDVLESRSVDTDSGARLTVRTAPLGLCAVPQPYGAYPYQWLLSDPFAGSSGAAGGSGSGSEAAMAAAAAAAWRSASGMPSHGSSLSAAALAVCSASGPIPPSRA